MVVSIKLEQMYKLDHFFMGGIFYQVLICVLFCDDTGVEPRATYMLGKHS